MEPVPYSFCPAVPMQLYSIHLFATKRNCIMKKFSTSNRAHRFISGTAVFALALTLTTAPSFAQEAAEEAEAEAELSAIIVTGSRISRPELDVASPIVSISAETIAASGKVNLSDYLIHPRANGINRQHTCQRRGR
jgi:hypothetical protein